MLVTREQTGMLTGFIEGKLDDKSIFSKINMYFAGTAASSHSTKALSSVPGGWRDFLC